MTRKYSNLAKALIASMAFFFVPGAAVHAVTSLPGVVCRVPIKEKVVALTFDDGPHPTYTPQLLQMLEKYNVKATFFVIGSQAEKYPDIVRMEARMGHVVANHTFSHPKNMELLSAEQMSQEIAKCDATLDRIVGRRPQLFRPPKGLLDGTVLTQAEDHGVKTVLWSVCADNHAAPTPELMARRVIDNIRPGGIILAHDGTFETRWKDVAATPLIIEGLTKQGYKFVTVPELIEMGQREAKEEAQPLKQNPAKKIEIRPVKRTEKSESTQPSAQLRKGTSAEPQTPAKGVHR